VNTGEVFERVFDGGFGVIIWWHLSEVLYFVEGFGWFLCGLLNLDIVLLFIVLLVVDVIRVIKEVLDLKWFSLDIKFSLRLVSMQLAITFHKRQPIILLINRQ
jgi:hypothetical protein